MKRLTVVILYLCIAYMAAMPSLIIDQQVEYTKFRKHYDWLTFPVFSCAVMEANRYSNVTVDNVLAIIHHETLHVHAWKKASVRSYSGAIGYMQIMPLHAKYYGIKVHDLTVMEINIKVGTNIYANYKKMYGNNDKKAIMAYNAGPYSDFTKYNNDWYLYGILEYAKATGADNTYNYARYL